MQNDVRMKLSVREFDRLVGEGIQPIALHPDSKVPIIKSWNKDWNEIEQREHVKRPLTNIGILLGDIVDVEGDSVKANETIAKLVGDYPHPVYKSKKSFHHLFINPDPELRILIYKSIEFRGIDHQSVVPPSKVNGVLYEWIYQEFPIPKMPDALLRFYNEIKDRRSSKNIIVKAGRQRPYCSKCRKQCFIHNQRLRFELMAFKEHNLEWQCHKCREIDIRPRVREIKKVVQKNENISDWRDWLRWKEFNQKIN